MGSIIDAVKYAVSWKSSNVTVPYISHVSTYDTMHLIISCMLRIQHAHRSDTECSSTCVIFAAAALLSAIDSPVPQSGRTDHKPAG